MSWRVAKSLEKLRIQVNAQYPGRDKSSDGAIGNAEHASRSSDHNPWVMDGSMGIVTARDISHDPKSGCDAGILAQVLLASRDPRIKYIIWNRQITSGDAGPKPWVPRKYTGVNPHQHHCHISVKSEKSAYDDERDWLMPGGVAPKVPTLPQPKITKMPTLLLGNTGEAVRALQKALGFEESDIDGYFGSDTYEAVRAFQKKKKLGTDGKVGQLTWLALLKTEKADTK